MERLQKALENGPYGLCVYGACGNDVNDHQHVLMEFESGATATVSVIASTAAMCERQTEVYGSRGEIRCTNHKQLEVKDFETGKSEFYDFDENSKVNFECGDEEDECSMASHEIPSESHKKALCHEIPSESHKKALCHEIPSESHKKALCGHGSGDGRLMDSFLDAVRRRKNTLPTNHLVSFA
eukprot:Lankesteria_metandrocarpae@DN3922_c0_g1_i1.p1